MSSTVTLFYEQLARLIGERIIPTHFRKTDDIAWRNTSGQPPLRKIALPAAT